ncbi:hypothetical protein J6590_051099 [Homalodisca vitripennis]|nr:hypothetical protein J6590_051099 [Homalodisca vitripennis]
MAASRTLLSVFIALSSVILLSEAHVALTFPPARKYDLDFLDNSRTKGPCGMPKAAKAKGPRPRSIGLHATALTVATTNN